MDRIVTATEANRAFSRILNAVEKGEAYVVTSRGRPVARLSPAQTSQKTPVAPRMTERLPSLRDPEARREKVNALVDELLGLPARAPGRITRDDGYE